MCHQLLATQSKCLDRHHPYQLHFYNKLTVFQNYKLENSVNLLNQFPTVRCIEMLNYILGTFMALQPVALGVNGEIGYVAVQQPNPENNFVPGQEIAMDHQNFLNNMFNPPITSPSHHQSSAMVNQNYAISGNNHGGGSFSSTDTQPSQEALRQESERMKQELEVLQKKISCLNTQRMNNSSNGGRNFNFGADDRPANQNNDVICSTAGSTVAQNETKQLATELQLIENTIKDREREMIQIRQPNMAGEGEANVEYGSYVAQGMCFRLLVLYI